MGTNASILRLDLPWQAAINQVKSLLNQAGFYVRTTFDLERARCASVDCPCDYHSSELCSLQMVVLLVYTRAGEPVTLIAHGDGKVTEFSLVNTPEQQVDPRLEEAICSCLAIGENPAKPDNSHDARQIAWHELP